MISVKYSYYGNFGFLHILYYKQLNNTFKYGSQPLTVSLALAIAESKVQGIVDEETRRRIRKSSEIVAELAASGNAVYGINTGFGPLCTTTISEGQTRALQRNILISHAVGVGKPISRQLSKLMLILKVHALCLGYSGVQEATINRILWHIENDIIPVVPEQGSVGASGDLAPLAHLFLPLIGEGVVYIGEHICPVGVMLKKYQLEPLTLAAKEGLALINGTQFIAAHAALAVHKLHNLLVSADITGAMMIEGLRGSSAPFLEPLHQLRPFAANLHVAATVRNLLHQSEIVASHIHCAKVQDPYSLRCIPQAHGASRSAWLHLKEAVETEINSVTDNPVIINEQLAISGGNFHGQPLALPIDYACLATSEIGNISDRRIYLSLTGYDEHVPKLLIKEAGINSGFMIVQYTSAALASENKGLCFPSSADSIPTSLGQEDHVSMGSIGGRKLLQIIDNTEKIIGIELLCACQAIDFHQPLKPGKIVEAIHNKVRNQIPHIENDVVFKDLIDISVNFVQSNFLQQTALNVSQQERVPFSTAWSESFDNY